MKIRIEWGTKKDDLNENTTKIIKQFRKLAEETKLGSTESSMVCGGTAGFEEYSDEVSNSDFGMEEYTCWDSPSTNYRIRGKVGTVKEMLCKEVQE